jgi:hypothetical protein
VCLQHLGRPQQAAHVIGAVQISPRSCSRR